VDDLFDASARHYDRANVVLSFGTGTWYRRKALERAGLRPGMHVADVGCGTGVVASLARRVVGPRGTVTGIDPSRAMRHEAAKRRGIAVVEGTAERMPLEDASIDFISMGYALRHVSDLGAAFREFARVLRPGGRVLILEITAPASRLRYRLLRAYLETIVPRLTRIATGSRDAARLMAYHWDSIDQCIAPAIILESIREAGFEASRRVVLGVLSEYTGRKPDEGHGG
jgi:demethylmenaquinone methyltransferase/2-methoxy-6-polyprenyl-1,4-benzoquinol methylase